MSARRRALPRRRPGWPEVVAGVDEAGRGPLAGPVVAAAVILRPRAHIAGLRDSKRLSGRQRADLVPRIHRAASAHAIGVASVAEIDQLNILAATMLAMQRAIRGLGVLPELVAVDGNQAPLDVGPCVTIVGGDDKVAAISAASVLAKEYRDRQMTDFDVQYPGYDFARHKGYGTAQHLAVLAALGPSAIHRHSFAPVRAAAQLELFAEVDLRARETR